MAGGSIVLARDLPAPGCWLVCIRGAVLGYTGEKICCFAYGVTAMNLTATVIGNDEVSVK